MRRILVISFATAAVLLAGATARAQDRTGWEAVVLGGVTQASLSGSNQPFSDSDSRLGFTGGTAFMLRMSREFGWEFGLRYSQKGADGKVDLTDYTQDVDVNTPRIEGDGATKLDYIELPVAVAGYLPTGGRSYLRGYLGASFGVLVGATFEGTLEGQQADVDIKDRLQDWDLCWIIGASFTLEFDPVNLWLDARYSGGTRSVDNTARDYDVKTSTREFAAGVGFPLGR